MLSFYLYGVVVLIAIVLLIVFNVRAAKKRSEPKQPEQPTLIEKKEEHKTIAAPSERPTAARQPSKTSEPVQSDGDYRQALRQFQSKDERTAENQDKNDPRINDVSYREGLRSMHKRE